MSRKRKKSNWAKALQEIENEQLAQQRARRLEREEKLQAEKVKQVRKNRSKEWTVIWQGGAPQ